MSSEVKAVESSSGKTSSSKESSVKSSSSQKTSENASAAKSASTKEASASKDGKALDSRKVEQSEVKDRVDLSDEARKVFGGRAQERDCGIKRENPAQALGEAWKSALPGEISKNEKANGDEATICNESQPAVKADEGKNGEDSREPGLVDDITDKEGNDKDLNKFRRMDHLSEKDISRILSQQTGDRPSLEGLSRMRASGSSQFSKDGLDKLTSKLGGVDKKDIVAIDLRQESHGFIGDRPVSWKGERNQANRDKSYEEVDKDNRERIQGILNKGNASIIKVSEDANNNEKEEMNSVDVKEAVTEKELVESMGMGYERFQVTDLMRPEDDTVDKFVSFSKNLPENKWLHFHCKAGKGRTTTFLSMYDMMRNADKVSAEDVVKRQNLKGGSNLFDVTSDPEKTEFQNERKDFLEKFHEYARENMHNNFEKSWSEWLLQKAFREAG